MSNERTYFVQCADGCLFESMTKEQILTAIEQAVQGGTITDVDTGFITKIKEKHQNTALTFWVGTQAEYNAIATKSMNCFYIITDDTTEADIDERLTDMEEEIETIVDNYTVRNVTSDFVVTATEGVTITPKLYRSGNVVELYLTIDATGAQIRSLNVGTINYHSPKEVVLSFEQGFGIPNMAIVITPTGNGTASVATQRPTSSSSYLGSGTFKAMWISE